MGLFDETTAPGELGSGGATFGGPAVQNSIAGPTGVEGEIAPLEDANTGGAAKGIGAAAGGSLQNAAAKNAAAFNTIFGHATSVDAAGGVKAPAQAAQGVPPTLLGGGQGGQQNSITVMPASSIGQPPPMMSDRRTKMGIRSGVRDVRSFLDAIANGRSHGRP